MPSLLSHLKQAPLSSLNRKRKVAQNLPHDGKRRKTPRSANNPKIVTPELRVKQFPGENLVVSTNKLFCMGCTEVALKKSIVELHVKSDKHAKGKQITLQGEARTGHCKSFGFIRS